MSVQLKFTFNGNEIVDDESENTLFFWCKKNNRLELLDEWDYEKNKITPRDVAPKSNKKYWWICKYGHEYYSVVYSKLALNNGCPTCAKELKTSFPEKAVFYYAKKCFPDAQENFKSKWLGTAELDVFIPSINVGIEYDGYNWHKDIEKDIRKDEKCGRNGVFLYRIREEKCPTYESGSNKIFYGNSFEIIDLDGAIKKLFALLSEKYKLHFDLDVNIEKDYSQILEYYISNEKKNNLMKIRPDLAKEWDYEKNGKIKPEFVSLSSNKHFWWRCPKCQQSYRMTVNNRTGSKHSNCPICSSKRIVKGINDLFTTNPELKEEWDFDKNTISPERIPRGTHKKAWWKCAQGHSWQAPVYVRATMKCGCPYCHNQVATEKNNFAVLYPELLKEWDYEKNERDPSTLLPTSNLKFWWKCKKCGYGWMTDLAHRVVGGRGCPLCAHQVLVKGINDLETQFPEIAKEWNYEKNILKPYEVSGGTNKKYWWKCSKCGHEWECVVASRTKRGSECPICRKAEKKYPIKKNSFAVLHSELLAEWDYEKNDRNPFTVAEMSNKVFWWKCKKCGYGWKSNLSHRVGRKGGCPLCAHQVLVKGINDLETQFPEIAKEWNYEKNILKPYEVSGGTNKKYWWKCSKCGHEWECIVASRTKRGSECPICRKAIKNTRKIKSANQEKDAEK